VKSARKFRSVGIFRGEHPVRAQACLPAGRLSATFLLHTFLWWPKKSMSK
jgi:hypothetical protein